MKMKEFWKKNVENRKNRICIAVLVGILCAQLAASGERSKHVATAWWGVMYPQYCYSQVPEGTDVDTQVRFGFRWLRGL